MFKLQMESNVRDGFVPVHHERWDYCTHISNRDIKIVS